MDTAAIISQVSGQAVERMRALSGGCIGDVYRVWLVDGSSLVAKVSDDRNSALDIEGAMLRYLAENSHLPVPQVLHSSPTLLLMRHLPGTSRFDTPAQTHAAELLAALHDISAPHYGLSFDTLIGGLHQPNPPSPAWVPFFVEHRLLYMGRVALDAGQLSPAIFQRLEMFAARVHRWLIEPSYPSLIHGDVWTTNVLAEGGRITGFIDPAIYYAHPEIELAFITLFNTFQEPFFTRYHQLRPIQPGFFEERRDIYNLYPLLVHVRLFGAGYASAVDRILRRFGC